MPQQAQCWGAALAEIDRPGMEVAIQKGEEKLPAGRSSREWCKKLIFLFACSSKSLETLA